MKMHPDEVETSPDLVRRLLAAQLPAYAELPIERVDAGGTVNALFRLGTDMAVRLPRRADQDIDREHATLRRIGPELPVEVPEPLAKGRAGDGHPFDWCIHRWLEGESPLAEAVKDRERLARDIAAAIAALWSIDGTGAPTVGRGTSLVRWDAAARKGIEALASEIDVDIVTRAWEESLAAPESQSAVWVHGDLIPGNILMRDGRLAGILDWGGSGLGDPACDLQPAWALLDPAARAAFRELLDVDDATWIRGRGWALWTALAGIPYYRETNPVFAQNATYKLTQVVADVRGQ